MWAHGPSWNSRVSTVGDETGSNQATAAHNSLRGLLGRTVGVDSVMANGESSGSSTLRETQAQAQHVTGMMGAVNMVDADEGH